LSVSQVGVVALFLNYYILFFALVVQFIPFYLTSLDYYTFYTGPPNAGKSSLFNLLARRDAAIVSPIAGTTRDVLQVSMDLGGIKCTLQDTAGVRTETTDVLELEGIKRAQKAIKEADLIVAMIDATNASSGLKIVQSVLMECDIIGDSNDNNNNIDTTEDGVIDSQRLLLVRNKLDLIEKTNSDATHPITTNEDDGDRQHMVFGEEGTFDISCYNQDGIDTFIDALTQKVVARTRGSDSSGSAGEGALITRARHRQHVEAAVMALERFSVLSREGSMAVDMAAEELRLAASELGRITGAVDVEDVLDVLFTDFCIGK
jgi:tRNA modification GTPase